MRFFACICGVKQACFECPATDILSPTIIKKKGFINNIRKKKKEYNFLLNKVK